MKLQEETKKKVEELATRFGKEVKDVIEDYKVLYTHPVVSRQANREETAYIMLFSQYANELGRPTEAYSVYILNKGQAKTFTKKDKTGTTTVQKLGVLCMGPGDTEPKYGLISHYEDTLLPVMEVQNFVWYTANLIGKLKDNAWKLSGAANTKYKIMPVQKVVDPHIDILPVLERTFKKINLSEIDFNVGNDTKIIDAYVVSSAVITTKKETKMGLFSIIDGSLSIDDAEKLGGGFTVICDPTLVKWKCRDHLLFVGRVSTSEEYGTGFNADVIIPLDIVSELPKNEADFSPESQEADEDTVIIDVEDV